MTRRPAQWQAEKARTAKALRELPKCDYVECKKRGMGHVTVGAQTGDKVVPMQLWVCSGHAQKIKAMRTRAAAPRET